MTPDPRAWRFGFRSLVEAALAHGAGQRRADRRARKRGQVIKVDFTHQSEPRQEASRALDR